MTSIKLTRIGNSVGAIIPKEALTRLRAEAGDTLYLTETADGYRITPYNPEFEAQMTAAGKIMKRRRTVLRQLAK